MLAIMCVDRNARKTSTGDRVNWPENEGLLARTNEHLPGNLLDA